MTCPHMRSPCPVKGEDMSACTRHPAHWFGQENGCRCKFRSICNLFSPMKLWERVGMSVRAALLGAALMIAASAASAQSPFKIGFISTFSGPQASIGQDMRRSAELALEHLGGKMGGRPVEFVWEDDQVKPDVGKQKSDKLVQQDKVDFVAGYIW